VIVVRAGPVPTTASTDLRTASLKRRSG
jgi:hypothetical protein